jgi:hypothetical protein
LLIVPKKVVFYAREENEDVKKQKNSHFRKYFFEKGLVYFFEMG